MMEMETGTKEREEGQRTKDFFWIERTQIWHISISFVFLLLESVIIPSTKEASKEPSNMSLQPLLSVSCSSEYVQF